MPVLCLQVNHSEIESIISNYTVHTGAKVSAHKTSFMHTPPKYLLPVLQKRLLKMIYYAVILQVFKAIIM